MKSLPSSTKNARIACIYRLFGRWKRKFLFHISSIFSSISNEWTSATSRKINGSYSEISVPYSQITKGYWRTIWHRLVTLRAERRSAPWCPVESREVSSRQQGGEWRLAGKVLAFARFPRVGGLLTARWWFAYCSQLVCLLEAKTNPYCQESI